MPPKKKGPPVGKLTPQVCQECEQEVLVGWSAAGATRLEPGLIDSTIEPILWRLGVPTYAVARAEGVVSLVLRTPAVDAPPFAEVGIAHMCDAGTYQTGQVLRCPQWFGHSKYVVARVGMNVHVLMASELGEIYEEVGTCSTPDAAWTRVQVLNWRDRARMLR